MSRNLFGDFLRGLGYLERAPYWSNQASMSGAIAHLTKLTPPSTSDGDAEEPIFVLSASWRSGSTWIQRILIRGGILVWGEPYDFANIVQTLSSQILPFAIGWPPNSNIYADPGTLNADNWTANAYPSPQLFKASHRLYFESLFSAPAKGAGYVGWGIKEVRLGGHHAAYLQWLFPKAKFIFLVRHPYESFSSYRETPGWYYSWPDDRVLSADKFANRWKANVDSFLLYEGKLNASIFTYERLRSDVGTIRSLEVFLGRELPFSETTLARGGLRERKPLNAFVKLRLRRQIGSFHESLGYTW